MEFFYVPVASSFVQSDDEINRILGDYLHLLHDAGGIRIHPSEIKPDTPVFFLAVTGGVESEIIKLHAIVCQQNQYPLYLLAHPGNNSLPASLETLAKIQQDGARGKILYLDIANQSKCRDEIVNSAKYLSAYQKLQTAKIGVIGEPSDWLIASMQAPPIVRTTWGPTLIELDYPKIKNAIRNSGDIAADNVTDSLVVNAEIVAEPDSAQIADAVKVYKAIKDSAVIGNVDAVTVRCFDLVSEMQTTGCFALSQLTDEGIIGGCEGDIPSVIGLLWAKILTNETPWMANPAHINATENKITLAHCTVPRSIVASYSLRSHFESGLGVGIQGNIHKTKVTLLRIGGRNLEKLWIAEGHILENGNSENLCRTQVTIQVNNDTSVNELLLSPLGNHVILVAGHHKDLMLGYHTAMV